MFRTHLLSHRASPTPLWAKAGAWILIVAVLHPSVVRAQAVVDAGLGMPGRVMPAGGPLAMPVPAPPPASAPAPGPAPAAGAAAVETEASAVRLVAGRSTVLEIGTPITRVSLTSADVADALVTSPTQLLIHGKAPGTISLFVWERAGAVRRYEVIVARDVARLADQLEQLFPTERIAVSSNGRDVVLSGSVSKKEIADQVINLSAGFVDRKEDVVSLLRVQNTPSNQVLLKVRFAEVSRSAMTELGASFFTSPQGFEGWVGRTTTQQFSAPTFDDGKLEFSDFLNLFVFNIRNDLGAVIRALQTRGLFQSLAEPNLVAESGKEASFLAGGEFPIPVTQPGGGNAITVQFKEFGVRLNFTPVVQGDRVRLKVRPEVSTLDFANGVHLDGFRIPALISRRAETELEIRDGQTFAIAGLLNNQLSTTMQKIPGIGDIPIIGYLFRSKAASKERTELVVMITPHILPEGSYGVTREVPQLGERYLDPLPNNRSVPTPPAPFPMPGVAPGAASVGPDGPVPVASEAPAAPVTAARSVPNAGRPAAAPVATTDVQPAVPVAAEPTAAERKAAERAAAEARKSEEETARETRKLEEERAREARKLEEESAREARRQARLEEEARKDAEKRDKAEAERQRKTAAEQAKREAEAARKKAEEERRAAEEAKRREEAEKKRQSAVDDAAAKVREAQAAYQAEVARSSR